MCDCVCLACFGACAAAFFIIGIYFFFGVIFTSLAIRAKTAINSYDVLLIHSNIQFSEGNLYLNLCITIGVLFTLLTFLGWAGEKKGKKTRFVYAGAQLAIIIIGMFIYIGLYPNESSVEKFIAKSMNTSLHLYGDNSTDESQQLVNATSEWDRIQTKFGCCGIHNYLDWEDSKQNPQVPVSCCREDHRMRGCSNPVSFMNPYESNKIIYVMGCFGSIRADTLGHIEVMDYFLIPILFLTCFGFVVTCCSSGVKKDDENVEVKKVGPIVLRRNTKKKVDKDIKDVENPEPTENLTQLALTEKGDEGDDVKKVGSAIESV